MTDKTEEIYALPFRRYTLRKMGINAKHARVVRVIGAAMSPELNSGDVVGINTNDTTIKSGDLYAIRIGNLIRVNRLIISGNGMIIVATTNKDFMADVYSREDFEREIKVLGRVFWSSKLW